MENRNNALGIPEALAKECGLQCYVEVPEFSVDLLYDQYREAVNSNDLKTKKRVYAVVSREAEKENGAAVNLLAVLHTMEYDWENRAKVNRLLRKSAELGSGVGCWNLAQQIYDGVYLRKDSRETLYWMEKALEKGNRNALQRKAYFYEHGDSFLGIQKDVWEAAKLYEKLLGMLEKDELDKRYRTILYKSVACSVEANWFFGGPEKAEEILEPLLRIRGACTEDAYYLLGKMYRDCNNGKKTLEMFWGAGRKGREAIEKLTYKQADNFDRLAFFEEMAEQGDVYANKYLGDMYAEGRGCVKNYAKALECYVHAKDGNLKEECEKKIEKMKYMEYCRQLYERAMEAYRTESYELAIVKMEKLAEKENYPDAKVFLAKMMENGHLHYAKNQAKALKYYREAAEKNQKEAQRKLVEIYRHGLLGAEKVEEKAAYWEECLKQ